MSCCGGAEEEPNPLPNQFTATPKSGNPYSGGGAGAMREESQGVQLQEMEHHKKCCRSRYCYGYVRAYGDEGQSRNDKWRRGRRSQNGLLGNPIIFRVYAFN
ncbi:hypothetical protein CASFOL_026144 [Castilleja foliolosa]|uniref:Uncharacterized protein n=1 Tax=Castilleja foliolosa TaxID=1961234 RepID=A0ABD3CWX4_9LAMI